MRSQERLGVSGVCLNSLLSFPASAAPLAWGDFSPEVHCLANLSIFGVTPVLSRLTGSILDGAGTGRSTAVILYNRI